VEEPQTVHPDEITVLKQEPETDVPLARNGEPIAVSRIGPSATDVESGSPERAGIGAQ